MRESSWRGYLESSVTNLAVVDTLRVPNNDLLDLLNENSYNKGGAVLHMLRGVVGDSAFFRGIRRYYNRHIHGNAVTADLQRAMEEESGQQLGWFFNQWLYQAGYPMLRVTHRWDGASRDLVLTIDQLQPANWPAFRLPMQIAFTVGGQEVRYTAEVQGRSWNTRVPLAAEPTAVRVDPGRWVLKVVQ
jgi:aminopeptidase N